MKRRAVQFLLPYLVSQYIMLSSPISKDFYERAMLVGLPKEMIFKVGTK